MRDGNWLDVRLKMRYQQCQPIIEVLIWTNIDDWLQKNYRAFRTHPGGGVYDCKIHYVDYKFMKIYISTMCRKI
jgi:hypothetical protein